MSALLTDAELQEFSPCDRGEYRVLWICRRYGIENPDALVADFADDLADIGSDVHDQATVIRCVIGQADVLGIRHAGLDLPTPEPREPDVKAGEFETGASRVWAVLTEDGDEVHAVYPEPVGLDQASADYPGLKASRKLEF